MFQLPLVDWLAVATGAISVIWWAASMHAGLREVVRGLKKQSELLEHHQKKANESLWQVRTEQVELWKGLAGHKREIDRLKERLSG